SIVHLVSLRHCPGLVLFAFFAPIFAFPASAQTSSDSKTLLSSGTADVRAQSESTGGPTRSNPATSKTGSNAVIPNTKANSATAKAESKPGGAQPESNPGTKKAGSAVLIN